MGGAAVRVQQRRHLANSETVTPESTTPCSTERQGEEHPTSRSGRQERLDLRQLRAARLPTPVHCLDGGHRAGKSHPGREVHSFHQSSRVRPVEDVSSSR